MSDASGERFDCAWSMTSAVVEVLRLVQCCDDVIETKMLAYSRRHCIRAAKRTMDRFTLEFNVARVLLSIFLLVGITVGVC